MKNFALIGAAGYIAPRHLRAIKDTNNHLVAALDPSDSVGILDSYFPEAEFFTEPSRFERHLEKLKTGGEKDSIDYVSVCSPNHLHDSHIRMALRSGADAICEKPLVITPRNLGVLERLEKETNRSVFTILQLRVHPEVVRFKRELASETDNKRKDVVLSYVTPRGPWYRISWKGDEEKSGGLAMNIGVHLFDLCLWLFGPSKKVDVHVHEPTKIAGMLELERARVRWFLSLDRDDIPSEHLEAGNAAYRSLKVDGREIEFSKGFTDLHTKIYKHILKGEGSLIDDARPSVELVHKVRHLAPPLNH